jgi:hypothetical protein
MQLGGPSIGESKSSFDRERDRDLLAGRAKDSGDARDSVEAKENNFFAPSDDKGSSRRLLQAK